MSGSDHVTNGGRSGMISTAGLELPYPGFPGQVSGRNFSIGGESTVTFVKR